MGDSPVLSNTIEPYSLKHRRLAIAEKELEIKEKELSANIRQKNQEILFASPVLIAIASAIFGLLGTGIGALMQGYSSSQLERQKFEFLLIQTALEAPENEEVKEDRTEAAMQLLFLVDSGIIRSLDSDKIRQIAQNPENLPSLRPLQSVELDADSYSVAEKLFRDYLELNERGEESGRRFGEKLIDAQQSEVPPESASE